jgi:hypothetical protein
VQIDTVGNLSSSLLIEKFLLPEGLPIIDDFFLHCERAKRECVGPQRPSSARWRSERGPSQHQRSYGQQEKHYRRAERVVACAQVRDDGSDKE